MEQCKSEWQKYKSNQLVGRDLLGLGGALRLHIPVAEYQAASSSKGQSREPEQSSNAARATGEKPEQMKATVGQGHERFASELIAGTGGVNPAVVAAASDVVNCLTAELEGAAAGAPAAKRRKIAESRPSPLEKNRTPARRSQRIWSR